MAGKGNRKLSPSVEQELMTVLKGRFSKNSNRHKGMDWISIAERLNGEKLWSLYQMEQTGGEPDVVGMDKKTGEYIFMDCSPESPSGRRSLCYDIEALDARKENKPMGSAMGMASEMGIDMLDEAQYRYLQHFGSFDTKTSSWIITPADIRKKGGSLFGDHRYGQVFIYHNGASSYYAVRGFRGCLKV